MGNQLAPIEKHYFDCQCDCSEHVLRFVFDPVDGDVYTEVYLNNWKPLHQRLLIALKYVFKRKCDLGAFDCTMLRPEDYSRLKDLLDRSEAARGGQQ